MITFAYMNYWESTLNVIIFVTLLAGVTLTRR